MSEKMRKIFDHPVTIPAIVGVASVAAGFAGGYFLGKKHGMGDVNNWVESLHEVKSRPEPDVNQGVLSFDEEVDTVEFDISMGVDEVFERSGLTQGEVVVSERRLDPDEVDEMINDSDDICEIEPDPITHSDSVVHDPAQDDPTQNIFNVAYEGWDWEAEKAIREETHVYVLHRDEFFDDEMNFDQRTLTYFEGDDIMCDEEEVPVYNYRQVIGDFRWGHGSGDSGIFYIRNLDRQAEYEVLRDPGKYTDEILHLDVAVERKARKGPSKFVDYDDD